MDNKINGYISIIKENYKAAKNSFIEEPQACAGAIRTTLEAAVKLLWLKKYDKEPVWVINGKEEFNLFNAVTDSRFSSLFNEIIISDIHVIRKMCNDVLHAKIPFTIGIAQELLNRLEKCVEAIQELIELDVISRATVSTKNITVDTIRNKQICKNQIAHKIYSGTKNFFIENKKNFQKGEKNMKSGEIIRVRTNAALLNMLLGENIRLG